MASKYSISTIFKAIDEFSNPVKRMESVSKKFSNTLKTDFAKSQRHIDNFVSNFKGNVKNGMLIGLGLLGVGIGKFVSDSIGAWDAQNEALKSTEATLKSTGGTVGRTLEQLNAQSENLQKNTFFGDDTILQHVTAQMLTFTNITGTQFDRAQQAVIDVTAKLRGLDATGGDLQGTTIQLSKALNDPVKNLSALSRSGIQFSADQKKLVKQLVQSGQLWKAQDLILTEIEKQYGGTASAITNTTKGFEIQNRNLINNIQESIGQGIEPLRMKLLTFANTALKKIDTEKLAKGITKAGFAIFNFAKGLIRVIKVLKPYIILFGIFLALWKLYWVGMAAATFIVPMIKFIKIIMLIAKAKGIWIAVQWALNAALTANPIGAIIVGITALIAVIIIIIINWKTIVKWLKIGWEWLVKTWDAFKGLMIIFGPITFAMSFLIELIRGLIEHWGYITEAFKSEGIIAGILAIGKVILSALLAPIESLFLLLGKIPGVGKMFKEWGLNIGNFRTGMFQSNAPITQGDRMSYSKQETVSKGELTINDKSGSAEITKKPQINNYSLRMRRSGAF